MPIVMREIPWFEQSLVNMKKMLASEQGVLRAQMHRVVNLEQDITCLQNLINTAVDKGKREMPADWREKQFKGRRS